MKEYFINIKPLRQPDSLSCSITCLRMILDYYGDKTGQEEIQNFIVKATLDGGSFLSEMARFANARGFQVDCYAYNLYLTDPKDVMLSKEKLLLKLKKTLLKHDRDKYYDLMLESTIKAIKEGVRYLIKKPNFEIIKSYLSKKVPISVRLNYAALHNQQGDPFESHDIVLCGLKNQEVFYVDPEHAEVELISNEDLMFAILQSKVISASAYLLAIMKK